MLTSILSTFVLPLKFNCTILIDRQLVSNYYNLKLGIDIFPNADDTISIGFQRIKYLTEFYLHNSIFLDSSTDLLIDVDKLDNNIVKYPCETYDIFVGSILFLKFQTVTEKYFDIQYMSIASGISEMVEYNILDPYDCDLDLSGDYWWNQNNVFTGSKKIVTWDELNLTEIPRFKPKLIKGGLSSEH